MESFPDDGNGSRTEVFLLGAGCSAPGIPVMKDFMRRVRMNRELASGKIRDAYDATIELWQSCIRTSYVYDRWWENIEELFTQAHMKAILNNADPESCPLCNHLRTTIWDVARRPFHSRAYQLFALGIWKRMQAFSDIRSHPRPVVITTNYDLGFENAFVRIPNMRNGMITYPGIKVRSNDGAFGTLQSLSEYDEGTTLLLCKLHGSVNWLNTQYLDEPAVCVMQGSHADGECFEFQKESEVQKLMGGSDTFRPLIVPPSLGKASIDQTIVKNWQCAKRALRCAKYLWIVGYSFAETDTFMIRLLSEGLMENKELEHIFIVNRDGSPEWQGRIESVFARSWWRNGVQRFRSDFEVLAACMANNETNKASLEMLDVSAEVVAW